MYHFLHDGGEKLGVVLFEVMWYFVEDLFIGKVVELKFGKNFLNLLDGILFVLCVKALIKGQG